MPAPPDFTIAFFGQEAFDKNGVPYTRYRYGVTVPSRLNTLRRPELPRVNASKPGVTFISKQKKNLGAYYGGRRGDASTWCFELQADVVPPSWVYLDVKTPPPVHEYKSNLAETTL
ncbi:MAG: hypothetical protein ABR607_03290 [Pyrinomonadaceae bacterium]